MCPAVPTITLFNGVDMNECALRVAPLWMLLEERIGGQTAATILRQRFRRRWIARPRADRARQEWACRRSENRRPRESLPWESLSGPDLLIWILPVNPLGARQASRSRIQGRKPCEWLWLPARKRQHRQPPRFSRAPPASPRAIWAHRRFPLPSWSSGPCSSEWSRPGGAAGLLPSERRR